MSRDADRSEKVVGDEVGERLSGGLGDDGAKEEVPQVRVSGSGSWCEAESADVGEAFAQEPVGVGFWCGGGADPADGWWVRDAGAVLEEVAHLHGVPAAFGKDAGDEVGDVRVE